MTANVYWISLGGDDIVLKLDLLVVAQLSEYFKNLLIEKERKKERRDQKFLSKYTAIQPNILNF